MDVVITQLETTIAHQKKIKERTGELIMGVREKNERIMLAITFAQAGEHETAREFLREGKVLRKRVRPSPRPRLRKQVHTPSGHRR